MADSKDKHGHGVIHRENLAERVGFEPTVRFNTDNALAGRPIRPLWHLSMDDGVYPHECDTQSSHMTNFG